MWPPFLARSVLSMLLMLIASSSKRTKAAKDKLINVCSRLREAHLFLVFLSINKMKRKERISCGMIQMKRFCLSLNETCSENFSFRKKSHKINMKNVFAVFIITNTDFIIGQLKGKDR